MVSSMTGYGRGEYTDSSCRLAVEMKAVNNRYLDMSIHMPKKFAPIESRMRDYIKSHVGRGKVDLYITYETFDESESSLTCNKALAAEYITILREMAKEHDLKGDISPVDLVRLPDVFGRSDDSVDEDALWDRIAGPLETAVKAFNASRAAEGEKLKVNILEKLEEMQALALRVEEREPQILAEYREKLTNKLNELLEGHTVDEGRIAAEVVIYADKISTDEETVRLKSHIEAMKKELTRGGAIGRKLDFLAQEMNREANTTLSKANDLETSDIGILLKTDIEKVREQIQNIE